MKVYSVQELHERLVKHETTVKKIVEEVALNLKEARYLNATTLEMIEEARQMAYLLDQKEVNEEDYLYGIPYGIKDNFCTKGKLTTASSKILANFIPPYESTATGLLRDCKAIGIVKTALDELGMGGHGLYAMTGDVKNPWDMSRIIGGSSSGSAALVACGALPFALGTDTGDSVRKPSAFSGIVGFKPSYGLISRFGVIPYAPSLDTVGILTRNVADNAIVLDALAKRDENDGTSIESKEKNYFKNLNADIKKLRVAFIKEAHDLLNPELKAFYESIYLRLENQDFHVDNVSFPIELLRAIVPIYMVISYAESISTHSNLDGINFGVRESGDSYIDVIRKSREAGFGETVKRRFVIGSYILARENQELLFLKAKRIRRLIVNQLEELFAQYDILLLAPTNNLPPLVSDIKSNPAVANDKNEFVDNLLLLANFAGNPSLTMPVGKFSNGMPVTININAKPFYEQTVLNFASFLEQFCGIKNLYATKRDGEVKHD